MRLEQIANATIIGTERQPLAFSAADDALSTLLNQLDTNDREGTALRAASVLAVWQRAGYRPEHDAAPALPPAEAEDLPCCSTATTHLLEELLSERKRDLFPEFVALMGEKRLRVPEWFLPAFLEAGRTHKKWRPGIQAVMGKRGAWLAEQNPAWRYITTAQASLFDEEEENPLPSEADMEEAWQTGTRNQRVALLTTLRGSDPDRARELVQQTWKEEPANNRLAFLETFLTGLSLADEPLLEESLDDKALTVRRQAAELLARLPSSQFFQRMVQRLEAILILEQKTRGLTKTETTQMLHVKPPSECSKEMIRDGIEPKPIKSWGEKAWWFLQMLRVVPASYWGQQWDITASELLEIAHKSDWKGALIQGWDVAATRHQDADWADVRIAHATTQKAKDFNPSELVPLFEILSPERGEAHILGTFQSYNTPLHDAHPAYHLLLAYKTMWSEQLAEVVLDSLYRRLTNQSGESAWDLIYHIRQFAPLVPPQTIPRYLQTWEDYPKKDDYFEGYVKPFFHILLFRQEMYRAI